MSRRHKRCLCGKVHAKDILEARTLHAQIWADKGGEQRVRFYACQYGSTHWTRMLQPLLRN